MPHPSSRYPPSTLIFFRLLVLLILAMSASKTTTVVYAQTGEKVVAVVNGRKVTQSEVDKSVAAQLVPLQRQIYAIRKAALENLIIRAILEDEAKKRGLSVEEFGKILTAGEVEISTGEVEKAYAENASVFAAMSPDEAKERLRLDLESQLRMQNYREALLRLKGSATIEFRLEEPRLPIISDDGAAPSKGSKEAAISIIEFSDFQCPFCRNAQRSINQVLQNYKGRVRLIFKHLPLEEIHPQAFSSSQAAFCAGEQGLFWQYHDALFASESLSLEVLNKIALDLGLNASRFGVCMNSEASRSAILKDIDEAKQLGINSTPTFTINGALFRGSLSFKDFQAAIERELKAVESTSRSR